MLIFVLGVISCIVGVALTAFNMFFITGTQAGYIGPVGIILFWAGFLMVLVSYSTTKKHKKNQGYTN